VRMANNDHLAVLSEGVGAWNEWRARTQDVRPDLCGADLEAAKLTHVNLSGALLTSANFRKADLSGASLANAHGGRADFAEATLDDASLVESYFVQSSFHKASLRRANLRRVRFWDSVDLRQADLREVDLEDGSLMTANLTEAKLGGARLFRTDLSYANLSQANLSGALLLRAQLVGTNLQRAVLEDCNVFGVSTWDLDLTDSVQRNLIITYPGSPHITVDNLEVAQFIHLLASNVRIRQVIDTITSKVVLVLGRFTSERKLVLDALRDELRKRDYLPVIFDFDVPKSRDLTETISLLAGMARFVIADLTDAKSLPQELSAIVPTLPSLAVQPLLLAGTREYAMFEHFRRYPWVLPVYEYDDADGLIASLSQRVVDPADEKARQLQPPSVG
jgi:uncharacterized protein YjbI with pentapeptide repeats